MGITAEYAVKILNEALALDPEAIRGLCCRRVPCNEALSLHPTIQVGRLGDEWEVGLLGILNGLFGINGNGWGHIAAVFDVVCANNCEGAQKNLTIEDNCPVCGARMTLGRILEFRTLA